jgi:outer membrane biosynthesis protein TonB
MIQQRKKSNSSKINLIISAVFHTVLILGVFYLAAKEGILGKKMQQLAVTMVKEKKPEPPKEKPPEPKAEQPKPEEAPKTAVVPPPVQQASVAPPPAGDTGPAVAPAAAVISGIDFSDGAKAVVEMASDPKSMYKALVEHTLRTRWNKPEDIADDNYVAEVELEMDRSGKIASTRWIRGSGDTRWDNSVKTVLAETKTVGKAPPKGFPEKFTVRFDVESLRTEPIQLSSR